MASDSPSILALSGSLRRDSLNQRLVEAAANLARARGASVTVVRLSDYPMPLYNPDEIEADAPPEVHFLKQRFRQHDGLLIASPEYNGLMTAALKNALDWVSHPDEGYPRLDCFVGKSAGIMAAAPGRLGGIRGLPSLRELLSGVGVLVVPEQVALPFAAEAFEEGDELRPSREREMLEKLVSQLLAVMH